MSEERLSIARREAWRSFRHKLGIVSLALLAYAGLVFLGNQKHAYANQKKEKWQLTQANLQRLADHAQAIAPAVGSPAKEGNEPGDQPIILSDTELLRDIATKFNGGGSKVKGTIGTKQELIAAAELLVDARIWRDSALRISLLAPKGPTADPAAAGTAGANAGRKVRTPAQILADGEHYVDRLAGEESLARTRIAGTHALIEASATQIELTGGSAAPLLSMFDEKHPLYVLYEISWYMLLSLAVLASSWLLVTVFTVLPFTEGEGYWTKRIGALLEKFAPGVASAALPIAAATLVAATVFTGTGFATTPGGYARSTTSVRTTIDDQSTRTLIEAPPPSATLNEIERALSALKTAIGGQILQSEKQLKKTVQEGTSTIDGHLTTADRTQRKTLASASSADRHAASAESHSRNAAASSQTAVSQTTKVEAIAQRSEGLANGIGTIPPREQPLIEHVGTIASGLADSKNLIQGARDQIETDYAEEAKARNDSLAQAAIIDPRGFFWRAFGRTLFKVGPAAVHQMAAFLHVPLKADGMPKTYEPKDEAYDCNAALITLLSRASELEPMRSGQFRTALYGLTAKTDPAFKCTAAKVGELVDQHDRRLLHLCALPRD